MTRALLIPYDENLPVEEFDYDPNRWTELAEKVTGSTTGMLDARTFPSKRTQLFYDDMGMYDQPNNINVRAMKLWAHLSGINLDFRQTLVGNFVVLGLSPEFGDTEDVPKEVLYFFGEEGIKE